MIRKRYVFKLIAACLLSFLPILFDAESKVEGTILPENYKLPTVKLDKIGPDKTLESWLSGVGEKSISDPLTRDVLEFIKQFYGKNRRTPSSSYKAKLLNLEARLSGHPDHEAGVLLPYLYELKYKMNGSKARDLELFYNKVSSKSDSMSCPRFRIIKGRLTDRSYLNQHHTQSVEWLNELKKSQNPEGVENVLKIFLGMVNKKSRSHFQSALQSFPESYDDVIIRFPWVYEDDRKNPTHAKNSLVAIRNLVKRRQCYSGRTRLVTGISKADESGLSFADAEVALEYLESCFRRKGYRSRISLFRYMLPRFEKSFGLQGKALVSYHLAKTLWNGDKFKETNALLNSLEEPLKTAKEIKLLEKVVFLQGQVAENQEDFIKALSKYKEYQSLFPAGAQWNLASRSQIIINSGLRKWERVLELARQMIFRQQQLSIDDRHVSQMGFGLFWAGRAAMELGKIAQAKEYWRMVARDYFSTYYGAIGHYMVERLSGESYLLQPFFAQKFEGKVFIDSFPQEYHSQVKRAKLLLAAGLEKEATCEASELPSHEDQPGQGLSKALFYYSAGSWLKAVQLFGNLPRSYRKNLGYGVERLLFPIKYEKYVNFYSEKASLDEAFIYSVIRQESVFNPAAYSVAGARGLMQLMTKTAQLEAKRLKKSYVSRSKKKLLMKKVRRKNNLYDSETNIILGVHYLKNLLNRYDSVPLALAAYNAGPTVVGRWRKKISYQDPFYFIEMIPYNETRDYVKLILRNYFYYKKWYSPGGAAFPQLESMTLSLQSLAKRDEANKSL